MISTRNFSIFIGDKMMFHPNTKVISSDVIDEVGQHVDIGISEEDMDKCIIRSSNMYTPSGQESKIEEFRVSEREQNALNRLAELVGQAYPSE